jgi:hypothetical protein
MMAKPLAAKTRSAERRIRKSPHTSFDVREGAVALARSFRICPLIGQ